MGIRMQTHINDVAIFFVTSYAQKYVFDMRIVNNRNSKIYKPIRDSAHAFMHIQWNFYLMQNAEHFT